MKRTLCFIGNSHLAAIKLAWDDVGHRYPELEVDFFGSRRDKLASAQLNGALIEPCDVTVKKTFLLTAGVPAIDTRKYDGFFIFSAGFSFTWLAQLYRQYRIPRFNARSSYLISESCFERAGRSLLEATPAMHLVRLIHSVRDDAPIVISAEPLPAPPSKERAAHPLQEGHDEASVYEIFQRICAGMETPWLSIKTQSDSTRFDTIFTKAEYSQGSVRLSPGLNVEHSSDDRRHMNRIYGAEVISNLFGEGNLPASESTLHVDLPARSVDKIAIG